MVYVRLRDQRHYCPARILLEGDQSLNQPFPSFPTNGDEEAYPNKIASYTKGLPRDHHGEVELPAYAALLKALETGPHAAFEAIPLGGTLKFANPQAAYAFALEGRQRPWKTSLAFASSSLTA